MQVAENARCEKHALAAGVGQVWNYVRVGGAKNHTGLQGWGQRHAKFAVPDLYVRRALQGGRH